MTMRTQNVRLVAVVILLATVFLLTPRDMPSRPHPLPVPVQGGYKYQDLANISQGCLSENVRNLVPRPRQPHHELHIVSQYYSARHPAQKYEVDRALTRNLANPAVAAIHILPESEEDFREARRLAATMGAEAKVVMGTPILRRMNYSDAFEYADRVLSGKYVTIQHADIYLDEEAYDDADFFELFLDRNRTALPVTRQNDPGCKVYGGYAGDDDDDIQEQTDQCIGKYRGSHDAFMFKAPAGLRNDYINYLPNHRGAENVLVSEFIEVGFQVFNTCRKYPIYHVDCNREILHPNGHVASTLPRINREPWPPAWYVRSAKVSPDCHVKCKHHD